MGNCIYKHQLNKCTPENTPKYEFKNVTKLCRVISVYDGDTITIAIRLEKTIYQAKVRMFGYDSPEMKPLKKIENRLDIIKDAKIAQRALADKILGKIVSAELLGFDKYGRLLANIHYANENLNKYMVDNEYGYPYFGGTKRP